MSGRVYLQPPDGRELLAAVLLRFGGAEDARGVARLPGGRVYGSGIVLTPDGRSVVADLTHDFGSEDGEPHWLQSYGRIRPPVRLAGRTAVVAVNLGSGYAHWLLEELPRWLALRPDDAHTMIANTAAPFIREVLSSGAFPQRVVPVARHSHFECETLVIPRLVKPGAELIATLTAFARTQPLPPVSFGEKLYITREGATRRRVSNETEVWTQLAGRGFTKLRLETLSWREQVAAFSAAKVVVGPHGAGLANVVFCRPGTRVVEFFNPAYVNPCYERLCRLAGLDYRADQPSANACNPRAGRLDIQADVAAVLAALSED